MAFNPFTLLTPELLAAFIGKGKKYFVRQSYVRGTLITPDGVQPAHIITHYSTLEQAHGHYKLLVNDVHKFLYDSNNPEHLKRLQLAASQPEGHRIFAAVAMPNWEMRAERALKMNVKNYIDHKLLWRPGRKDGVDFDIFMHLGEVYAKLSLRKQVVSVRLEEIENFK